MPPSIAPSTPTTEEIESRVTKQFVVTPAAGKRLIARALIVHPSVRHALANATLVVIAGTTNGYVAEELLREFGYEAGFTRGRFFRGATLPARYRATEMGRLPDESTFPGDVVIERGVWQKGKTIFDVVDGLRAGDVILKGANALDINSKRAAILIGHHKAGTIGVTLQAVAGRRVQLILPVGLEKRVAANLDELAALLNAPSTRGARLLPVPGTVFTELDAIQALTQATAQLIAAGGVCGAEGSVWLAVSGTAECVDRAESLLRSVASEPPFELAKGDWVD